jgi:tetratricopeptide (TPR) repeat protein
MTKKYFLPLLLLVFSIGIVVDDTIAGETDSLKILLKKNTDEKRKVELLNELSKAYFNDNPDSAIIISFQAIQLSQKLKFKSGEALSLKNLGIGYYLKALYLEAIDAWQKALKLYEEMGNKKGIANMYSNIGSVYFNEGDEARSLEYDLKALKISEEIHDTLRIISSLGNIGAVYLNKSATYDKALTYYLKAYNLSNNAGYDDLIGATAVNLGETYYKLNEDNKALQYLNIALIKLKNTIDYPGALNYLGKVFTRKKYFIKALNTHQEAYDFSKKFDTKLDMTKSLIGLAEAHMANGDLQKSIEAYIEALNLAEELKFLIEAKEIYEGLSKAYSLKKEYANAFKYQNLLLNVKDTIYNVNIDKKLGMLQFNFDLEKKESEINLLTKDKEIQEQEITRQKIVRNSFIGGFAIVLLFAAVFFKQRNRIGKEKKRSDELLLNILPEEVAEELKEKGEAEAKLFNEVSVLFTDFKGFTAMSEKLTPKELVRDIHECFSAFDRIMEKYGIEKIKTIGVHTYATANNVSSPYFIDLSAIQNELVNMTDASFPTKLIL